ncbi:MAG: flagellar basal body-associated protein FliL [Wolinella sp.]
MADETKESTQSEEKKSKMIIYIIAGVIALLLIIAGVIIAIMLSGGEPEENTQQTQAPAQVAPAQPQSSASSSPRSGGSYLTVGQMYPLDQFIVNLTTQSGRRYLKTTINLEISQPNLTAELDTKRAVIRDTVIAILSSKSIEEISTVKGKDKLKGELIDRLNEFLVDGKVVNLFFTDFVVQ